MPIKLEPKEQTDLPPKLAENKKNRAKQTQKHKIQETYRRRSELPQKTKKFEKPCQVLGVMLRL